MSFMRARRVCMLLALGLLATPVSSATARAHGHGPSVPTRPSARGGITVRYGAGAQFTVGASAIRDPLSTPAGPGFVALAPSTPSSGARARRPRQRHSPRPAPTRGEGLLALTMSAPGTSWASSRNTSVVAQVSIDGGRPQSIELFDGGERFTYEGFVGSITSRVHRVTVRVSPHLSHAGDAPSVHVVAAQLGVVPTTDPSYRKVAYAPFIYGRSSSATGYIPLLTYADERAGPAGSHTLSYTYVISAHDQGDSVVPAYQWGTWGRMTDVVSVIDETVAADGAVTSASYSSCGCESLPYPDAVQSPSDTTTKPFQGSWLDHHPVLRDATATNYLSDSGTTGYRFQQSPVAGPADGQVREAVMDAHPWTYRISNQELPREHVISTNPDDLLVGDYRQYAIVDSDIDTSGSESVQFEVRLAGDPTWYSTDYRQMTAQVPSTFAFHDGGHNRTVIKLPTNWGNRPIDGLRVRLTVRPGSPPATATIRSLKVLALTPRWTVIARATPAPDVYQALGVDPMTLPV